ncbi:DUF4959 domain-containing protein [Sphingobacterium phlebotomi]|uniref:DUF4959 domain-containing protein n=1 Tax=Sphingobacterium phlebotomi TaxID=2605433 RepID=A0A5D4H6E7_9SPHI|nr:DUF4959 domain-containing protein [Sphingobacterium phlebotomi]TYR36621.1 DUF4959 domain-containing protein [Sphingobacterium phlebotomi]
MKNIVIIVIATLFLAAFSACSEIDDKRPVGGDWASGPLEEYEVTPINGGAEIRYSIPNDPDILYVMAEYERNGRTYTEKASVHTNSLKLEGFHRVNKAKATLYKVNRQEQRSAPVEVEFEPLPSTIDLAFNSLEMMSTFGGVFASWENPYATELGVRFMTVGEGNKVDHEEMYFSSIREEGRAFRGFEAVETTFALSFEDKWGNISDTTWLTTVPNFETLIPKPYADYRSNIPYDNTTRLASRGQFDVLWDNIVNTTNHGWLTQSGSSGISITIDMQQVAKLSRIVVHPYRRYEPYAQVNILQFEAWGIDEIDHSRLTDRPYWLDEIGVRGGHIHGVDNTTVLPAKTFKDDWTYLGWHAVPRYDKSGDIDAANKLSEDGAEFHVPLEARPVRYIRLVMREIAPAGPAPTTGPPLPLPSDNYFSMGEITFYGDNTN